MSWLETQMALPILGKPEPPTNGRLVLTQVFSVSSAVVQRYLDHVLEAALTPDSPNQSAAVDVLSFTIKQGLAHPLQSFPVIIALETSPVTDLSRRATALHTILQGKHASLLNTRYIISARASFDYQKKAAGGLVQGYRVDQAPVALLQRWYSLVREKRTSRQEFLRALVKVFQDNPSFQSSQVGSGMILCLCVLVDWYDRMMSTLLVTWLRTSRPLITRPMRRLSRSSSASLQSCLRLVCSCLKWFRHRIYYVSFMSHHNLLRQNPHHEQLRPSLKSYVLFCSLR